MRIQHNIPAMGAYRTLSGNRKTMNTVLEQLSSGYSINKAGDDAAGLAVSEKMRMQITGLGAAEHNVKDATTLLQTAEGALTEVHSMLNRMVELADQSANGTYDNEIDRDNLQKEFTRLSGEIDRIADSTNFNGVPLLKNEFEEALAEVSKQSGEVTTTALTPNAKVVRSTAETPEPIIPQLFSMRAAPMMLAAASTREAEPVRSVAWCEANGLTKITKGGFTIYGENLKSSDYGYSSGLLTIKTDKQITITTNEDVDDTHRIKINAGINANLTLDSVKLVDTANNNGCIVIGTTSACGTGNVNITCVGTNELSVYEDNTGAAITKSGTGDNNSGTLTITGPGTLKATGGKNAAGIGGSGGKATQNIIITGNVTVEATGGSNDTSEPTSGGAGIGGGNNGTCKNVQILNGANVTATGGAGGAGIGGGKQQSGSDIRIENSTVNATGTAYDTGDGLGNGGAGIGGGGGKNTGTGSNIRIIGSTVTATGNGGGAGIGGGQKAAGGGNADEGTGIYITGGSTVTATSVDCESGNGGAGIGGGGNAGGTGIVIEGSTVTADGGCGSDSGKGGAGIGGGGGGEGSDITISNCTSDDPTKKHAVTAIGGQSGGEDGSTGGAGIGGGGGKAGSDINITNSGVSATGGQDGGAAGIGGGGGGAGTGITISGGNIEATGTEGADKNNNQTGGAGIGGGSGQAGSGITIQGSADVKADGGDGGGAGVGGGSGGAGSTITIEDSKVSASGGSNGAGIGGGGSETAGGGSATGITISGSDVKAESGTGTGAAIGGGGASAETGSGGGATNINITGGKVDATSSEGGAAIGGGGSGNDSGAGGTATGITITGAEVTAGGASNGAAAIGGGGNTDGSKPGGAGQNITISGGKVDAEVVAGSGAAIGGGGGADGSGIKINANGEDGTVTATANDGGAGIGGGGGADTGTGGAGSNIQIGGGTVIAGSSGGGAGIGGGAGDNGEGGGAGDRISISGGNVTASGTDGGSGIGGGVGGAGTGLEISGGTVTAKGDSGGGAAIGGGAGQSGEVNISGGTISAESGGTGAGIGGGAGAAGGGITISGGDITATGDGGAGIGGGDGAGGGDITISGDDTKVTAGGSNGAAGIGGGENGDGGTIDISGGNVSGTGGAGGAGIGSGGGGDNSGGSITISGGTVTGTGGTGAAGIGGGDGSHSGTINITDGTVTGTGEGGGAGIGGGNDGSGDVTIGGGTVTGNGDNGGAGIGGGSSGSGNVNIGGSGSVTGTGDSGGAGIGGGDGGAGTVDIGEGDGIITGSGTGGGAGIGGGNGGNGNVTNGSGSNAIIDAKTDDEDGSSIGGGAGGTGDFNNQGTGLITQTGGDGKPTTVIPGGSYTFSTDTTYGGNLTIKRGETITIGSDANVTLNGTSTVIIEEGGTLEVIGTLNMDPNSTITVKNGGNLKVTGDGSVNVNANTSITIDEGGTLSNSGGTVTVVGQLTNNGTIDNTGTISGNVVSDKTYTFKFYKTTSEEEDISLDGACEVKIGDGEAQNATITGGSLNLIMNQSTEQEIKVTLANGDVYTTTFDAWSNPDNEVKLERQTKHITVSNVVDGAKYELLDSSGNVLKSTEDGKLALVNGELVIGGFSEDNTNTYTIRYTDENEDVFEKTITMNGADAVADNFTRTTFHVELRLEDFNIFSQDFEQISPDFNAGDPCTLKIGNSASPITISSADDLILKGLKMEDLTGDVTSFEITFKGKTYKGEIGDPDSITADNVVEMHEKVYSYFLEFTGDDKLFEDYTDFSIYLGDKIDDDKLIDIRTATDWDDWLGNFTQEAQEVNLFSMQSFFRTFAMAHDASIYTNAAPPVAPSNDVAEDAAPEERSGILMKTTGGDPVDLTIVGKDENGRSDVYTVTLNPTKPTTNEENTIIPIKRQTIRATVHAPDPDATYTVKIDGEDETFDYTVDGDSGEFVVRGLTIGQKGTITYEDENGNLRSCKFTVSNEGGMEMDISFAPVAKPDSGQETSKVPVYTTIRFQIGVTAEEGLDFQIRDMSSKAIGVSGLSVASQTEAADSIDSVKDAINMVSDYRGYIGAMQNRLGHTLNNLRNTNENITNAESLIRDVDVASKIAEYTKQNILIQSAQAMLAQANQIPNGVLQFLQ